MPVRKMELEPQVAKTVERQLHVNPVLVAEDGKMVADVLLPSESSGYLGKYYICFFGGAVGFLYIFVSPPPFPRKDLSLEMFV